MRVGDIVLLPVLETSTRLDARAFFPELARLSAAERAAVAPYLDAAETFDVDFHAWLVRTPDRALLIDPCIGNGKERPDFPAAHVLDTPFLERLAAAGARADEIDEVICTHLHFDHCGWNTRWDGERWVPAFPNATYRFAANEIAAWDRSASSGANTFHEAAYRDSVLPIVEAKRAATFTGAFALAPGITIEPAPGHTAGHVLIRLRRAGEEALLIGDIMHSPLQAWVPRLNAAADDDPAAAAATRRGVLADAARRGAAVLPAHAGAPYGLRPRERNGSFAAEPLGEGELWAR